MENVFSEMVEENTASCFERLMCDMAADPNSDAYSQHLPMMVSVQAAANIQVWPLFAIMYFYPFRKTILTFFITFDNELQLVISLFQTKRFFIA